MSSTCPLLSIIGESAYLLPEMMMAALALLTLLLSLTPMRHSTKSVYAVLWGQVAVLLMSLGFFSFNPSYLSAPIQSGLLHPNVGHDLVRLGIMVLTLIISWMTKRSGQLRERYELEYYALMMAASVAFMFAVQSSNFVSLFVSMEVGSLLMVLLMSLPKAEGLRSGLNYLIQASLSTIFFLWGLILLYAHMGSLDYAVLQSELFGKTEPWVLTGMAMVLLSLCFKLGLFPFTYWLVPVYKGLRLPAMAYVSTVSKLVGAVVLIDLLLSPFSALWVRSLDLLSIIVIVTLVWSAISALHQKEFRRLFALSGSVHAAFVVAGILFCVANVFALNAVYFYLLAYFSATLLALYCLLEINPKDFTFDSLRSVYGRHPGFSMMLVLSLASMAGLPPLMGFIAKFLMIFNTVRFEQWPMLAAMIAASVIGIYYYVSAIFALIGRSNDLSRSPTIPMLQKVPNSTRVITGFLMVIILGLGVVQSSMSLLWK